MPSSRDTFTKAEAGNTKDDTMIRYICVVVWGPQGSALQLLTFKSLSISDARVFCTSDILQEAVLRANSWVIQPDIEKATKNKNQRMAKVYKLAGQGMVDWPFRVLTLR